MMKFNFLISITVPVLFLGPAAVLASDDWERRMLKVTEPEQLKANCGDLTYEIFGAVRGKVHMGIFAEPTKDDTSAVPENCGPLFFHQLSPATKVAESSSIDEFGASGLHPLGLYKMTDILRAFDSVPVSDEDYDVLKTHCATLVLQMMCYLQIPVVQEMKDWTAGELMRTEESRDRMMTLLNNSTIGKGALEMAAGAAQEEEAVGSTIRHLVEYDAGHFSCVAPPTMTMMEEQTSAATLPKMALTLMAVALASFIGV